MAKLKEYEVGGYTFQLDEEDAKRMKATPVQPATKGRQPQNKARQPQNKAATPADKAGKTPADKAAEGEGLI